MKLTGEEIQRGRHAKRLTIHQLARALGVTAQHLSYVEHSRSVLSDEADQKAQEILGVKPRLSTRGCVGYGGTYESAIDSALHELRKNGHFWSSWTVRSHTIEPYMRQGITVDGWGFRHRVVLEVTRGAKRT